MPRTTKQTSRAPTVQTTGRKRRATDEVLQPLPNSLVDGTKNGRLDVNGEGDSQVKPPQSNAKRQKRQSGVELEATCEQTAVEISRPDSQDSPQQKQISALQRLPVDQGLKLRSLELLVRTGNSTSSCARGELQEVNDEVLIAQEHTLNNETKIDYLDCKIDDLDIKLTELEGTLDEIKDAQQEIKDAQDEESERATTRYSVLYDKIEELTNTIEAGASRQPPVHNNITVNFGGNGSGMPSGPMILPH